MNLFLVNLFLAARIDDGDDGYEHDDWQIETGPRNRTVSYPLRAERWWSKEGAALWNPRDSPLPPQENRQFSARVLCQLGLVSEPESARIALGS